MFATPKSKRMLGLFSGPAGSADIDDGEEEKPASTDYLVRPQDLG